MGERPVGQRREHLGLAGTAGAAVALGTSEAAAGLLAQPSPVAAVADAVINLAPPPVVRFGIDVFGTADKAALGVGIVVLCLGAGAAAGRFSPGWGGAAAPWFVAFALIGLLSAARHARASILAAVAVLVVAVAAGMATLIALARRRTPDRSLLADAAWPDDGGAAATGPSRRAFVAMLAAAGAVAAGGTAVGRVLADRAGAVAARAATVLPRSRLLPPPSGAELGLDGLSPVVTPNSSFYRIDTAFLVPRIDPSTWSLRVTGLVERPFALTYDELLELDMVERWITLACVSNEVGGGLIGNAAWLGVPLSALLDRAGLARGAEQVVGRSGDGFTVGFPTEAAFDGRDALVAVGMNGEPLPFVHGFPARLVVEGLYGYVSATKWLTEIELTTWDGFDAFWIPRGWAKQAPIKTQSRIDVPRRGQRVPAGSAVAAGVAWTAGGGIRRVELQVDDGPWQDAELAEPLADGTWRQWRAGWQATPGQHTLRVRATDGTGEVQTAELRPPPPDGATGHHAVRVEVG